MTGVQTCALPIFQNLLLKKYRQKWNKANERLEGTFRIKGIEIGKFGTGKELHVGISKCFYELLLLEVGDYLNRY